MASQFSALFQGNVSTVKQTNKGAQTPGVGKFDRIKNELSKWHRLGLIDDDTCTKLTDQVNTLKAKASDALKSNNRPGYRSFLSQVTDIRNGILGKIRDNLLEQLKKDVNGIYPHSNGGTKYVSKGMGGDNNGGNKYRFTTYVIIRNKWDDYLDTYFQEYMVVFDETDMKWLCSDTRRVEDDDPDAHKFTLNSGGAGKTSFPLQCN